ncbi:MAG: L,D-transpeptidase [Acidobacteria bacterium]|nr:MAG: L,D-transpeptidase [Acidobacteriota bacterium]
MKRRLRLFLTIVPPLLVFSSFIALLLTPVEPIPPLPPASRKEIARLERKLGALRPKGYYILVDTAANRLWLKRGDKALLEAKCSTGSGRQLECQGRSWTFETPRGEFRIQGKISNPIWRKPDWAFLEEGKSLPVNDNERFEKNVLGEYAMAIGDGYFIHGTLYNRMLGRNVTHGCIRLGSPDLIRLTQLAPVGTKVYIF